MSQYAPEHKKTASEASDGMISSPPQDQPGAQPCSGAPVSNELPVPPAPEDMHDVRLALENFSALLHSMDFGDEMTMLGVNRLFYWKRRRLKIEFVAMTMGLWRLALERSFPHYWNVMFNSFLKRKLEALDDPNKAAHLEKTIHHYLEILEKKREADFTEVGAHLVNLLKLPEPKAAPLRLRLTLHIRSLYTLVFDRLI